MADEGKDFEHGEQTKRVMRVVSPLLDEGLAKQAKSLHTWLLLLGAAASVLWGLFVYLSHLAKAETVKASIDEVTKKIDAQAEKVSGQGTRIDVQEALTKRIESDLHWMMNAQYRTAQQVHAPSVEPPPVHKKETP